MGLHYLIFMGRNLENGKKLTLVRIMNSVALNNKNVVGIFEDSLAFDSNFMK